MTLGSSWRSWVVKWWHLEFGRQWKVIIFHMFCIDKRVCIIFSLKCKSKWSFWICGYTQKVYFDVLFKNLKKHQMTTIHITCLICTIFMWKQYEPFYPCKTCGMQLLSIAFQVWDGHNKLRLGHVKGECHQEGLGYI